MTDIDLDIAAVVIALTGLLAAVGTYLKQRVSARKDEVSLLREEVARLHKRLDEQISENDALRKLNCELMQVNTNLQLKLALQGESIKDLQARLTEKDHEIAELQRELEELRKGK